MVKDRIREYWDSRCHEYDSSPGHTSLPEVWRDILGKIFHRKMRILDVGTGTGFVALRLAELGHDVTGIDLSEGMLSIAKTKATKAGLNVTFIVGDAENLPFDDESFDAVVCRHLLWTLPNPDKAVKEWARVVKPGGMVVAIDGKWTTCSMAAKLRSAIGRIAIAAYERRWKKSHYSREINKALPFYGGASGDVISDIFKGTGLKNVEVRDLSWIRERMLENLPFFYRLAWNGREYFAVIGVKES
ncbi:class I SAM-dependent methyltransferase [Archaeoglobus neptunius]|uniref:class I SAM-dependent methyltransferase n=1 Tax=Archaeoglobus neptunius TaxID=2798580 RepID=UPI001928C730|nr:class I SAM-dependent methyltransferase [Archaeoglobus neptunius]